MRAPEIVETAPARSNVRKVATVLGVAVLPVVAARDQDGRVFLAECEEVIKMRVKSPSTYQRVNDPKFSYAKRPFRTVRFEAPIAGDAPISQDVARRSRAEGLAYRATFRFVTVIEYDAANAFGMAIRKRYVCRSSATYHGAPSGPYCRRSGWKDTNRGDSGTGGQSTKRRYLEERRRGRGDNAIDGVTDRRSSCRKRCADEYEVAHDRLGLGH